MLWGTETRERRKSDRFFSNFAFSQHTGIRERFRPLTGVCHRGILLTLVLILKPSFM